jgi:hypothetical protein
MPPYLKLQGPFHFLSLFQFWSISESMSANVDIDLPAIKPQLFCNYKLDVSVRPIGRVYYD